MRIAAGFLCDAATIRDGLINILGAGVTRTFAKEYPTRLNVALACVLEFDEQADPPGDYRIDIRVVNDTKEHQLFEAKAHMNIEVQAAPGEGLPGYIPFVVSLGGTELPEPGRHHVLVTVNEGEPAWSTTFIAYRGTLADHEPFVASPDPALPDRTTE